MSLDDYWKQSLLFHFHDSITGTSNNQANFELLSIAYSSIPKFEEIESILLSFLYGLIQKKLNKNDSNQTIVFNPLCYYHEINDNLAIPNGGWKLKNTNSILYEKYETDFYERINIDDSYKVHHFCVKEIKLKSDSDVIFD